MSDSNGSSDLTTVQITAERRQELEQVRMRMTIEQGQIVLLRDAIDAVIAAGLEALSERLA